MRLQCEREVHPSLSAAHVLARCARCPALEVGGWCGVGMGWQAARRACCILKALARRQVIRGGKRSQPSSCSKLEAPPCFMPPARGRWLAGEWAWVASQSSLTDLASLPNSQSGIPFLASMWPGEKLPDMVVPRGGRRRCTKLTHPCGSINVQHVMPMLSFASFHSLIDCILNQGSGGLSRVLALLASSFHCGFAPGQMRCIFPFTTMVAPA
jgi:hypothetical protein